jgi:hypothetical protein
VKNPVPPNREQPLHSGDGIGKDTRYQSPNSPSVIARNRLRLALSAVAAPAPENGSTKGSQPGRILRQHLYGQARLALHKSERLLPAREKGARYHETLTEENMAGLPKVSR